MARSVSFRRFYALWSLDLLSKGGGAALGFRRVDPCAVLEYAGKVVGQGLSLWRRMPSFGVLEARGKALNATQVTLILFC